MLCGVFLSKNKMLMHTSHWKVQYVLLLTLVNTCWKVLEIRQISVGNDVTTCLIYICCVIIKPFIVS